MRPSQGRRTDRLQQEFRYESKLINSENIITYIAFLIGLFKDNLYYLEVEVLL